MKSKNISFHMVLGLALISSQWANADVATVSTASESSVWDRVSENAILNYFGTFRGGPLSDMGNSFQPATDGTLDTTSPLAVENYLTAGYKINKDLNVGMMGHFYYYPVGNPVGSGQDLEMRDPMLVFNNTNLANFNGIKIAGRLGATLPLTKIDRLQREHQATILSAYLIANYDVPKTALTVGIFSYAAGYVPTADTVANARTYKLYFAPNANYQISKTVAATLWVDLFQVTRTRGTGFFSGMDNATVDIEPGINWDITDKISFNPILNIYPSSLTLAATSVQANITAKAF